MFTLRLRPLPAPLPTLDAPAGPDAPAVGGGTVVADAPHSYPCRRCLRDAEVGEAMALLSYDPFLGASVYRQPGPIYVHAQPCAPGLLDLVPDQLSRRVLSVRAFTGSHAQVDAAVAPGTQLAAVARALFERADVAYLHVHNAAAGCFAVRIDRP